MNTINIEQAVIVRDSTQLERMTKRFGAKEQAKFYMQQNVANFMQKKGSSFTGKLKKVRLESRSKVGSGSVRDIEESNDEFHSALNILNRTVSKHVKTKIIDRSFLPNYIFTKKDVVIVLGQDGLVANTAKYVSGIPIIAINPNPVRYDGILLPFNANDFERALAQVIGGRFRCKEVTMAEVVMNDGQRMLAFNDFFVGVNSHKSARYSISYLDRSENHSSSGIIIATGAGSTGWMSSIFNMTNSVLSHFQGGTRQVPSKRSPKRPTVSPQGMPWDADFLRFVVREPFLSRTSQVGLTAGDIRYGQKLILESNMPENGIIFSDGIDTDFIRFNTGSIAEIGVAQERALLVVKA